MTGKNLLELVDRQQRIDENVISPLCAVRSHLSSCSAVVQTVMPHVLIKSAINSGKIVECVADSVVSNDLIERCGLYDLVRFEMRYCPGNQSFDELKRLIAETSAAAGHRCTFKGIVAVDITKWRGHFHEEYFNMAMAFLHDCSDDWYIVFTLEKCSQNEYREAQKAISRYFRTICVDVPVLSKAFAAECFEACFADLDFAVESDTGAYIMDTVSAHGDSIRRLDYELIEMVSRDIVCFALMHGLGTTVTRQIITEYFSDPNAFVYRNIHDRRMTVGFVGGRSNDQRV